MYSLEDDNYPDSLKAVYRPNTMANKQPPRLLAGLLLVLVILLHGWLALWLLSPKRPVVKKKPVMIEVSLLPAPVKQIEPAPVSKPLPVPIVKKTRPKKAELTKPKPLPKLTEKPVVKKKIAVPRTQKEQNTSTHEPAEEKAVAKPVIAPTPAPAFDAAKPAAQPTLPPKPTATKKPARTESQRATCVRCPNPTYPSIARRRGWQGSVLLKFQLTADGLAQNIVVVRSSGHEQLDQAAIDNAKESRFTQAEPGVIRTATKLFNFKLN